MSVDRIFGSCSEHGPYELPAAAVELGDVKDGCPACNAEQEDADARPHSD
jgi:hypothetical protein